MFETEKRYRCNFINKEISIPTEFDLMPEAAETLLRFQFTELSLQCFNSYNSYPIYNVERIVEYLIKMVIQ